MQGLSSGVRVVTVEDTAVTAGRGFGAGAADVP